MSYGVLEIQAVIFLQQPVCSQLEWRPVTQVQENTQPITQPEQASPKSAILAFVCCLTLGWFGVHQFYVGKTRAGLLYLFHCLVYLLGIYSLFEKSFGLLLISLLILSVFAASQFGVNGIKAQNKLAKSVYAIMLLISMALCALILNELNMLTVPCNTEAVERMSILYAYLCTFALGARPLIDLVMITQNKLTDTSNQSLLFIKRTGYLKYYCGVLAFMLGFIFFVYFPSLFFAYYFPV